MDYIGTVLFFLVLLKVKTIVSAITWIATLGEEHAGALKKVQQMRELSESDILSSFRDHGGNFFPFGVKEYKLRSLILRLRSGSPTCAIVVWARRCAAFVLDRSRLILFQYVLLSFLCAIFVMAAAITTNFTEVFGVAPTQNLRWITLAIVVGTLLMNILMAIEFVFGHLFLTDYALYFHMLSPRKTVLAGRSQVAVGLQIIVILGLVVFVTGVAAVFAVYLFFEGFGGENLDQCKGPSLTNLPTIIALCGYYALTTLTTTGYGDILPSNMYGVLVGVGLQVEAFAFIVFVLAVFWSLRRPT